MFSGPRRAAVRLALVIGGGALTLAPSFPPRYQFQTIESGRLRVHFHSEVESVARRALPLVDEILPGLEARYDVRVQALDVVVHDAADAPNGFATSFPYPLVEIRAAAPESAEGGPFDSWLRVVIAHELTHIVHIERARGLYGFGRRVFGRAPFLFPNALQPTWFIEGLATLEETRLSAYGRGRHTLTETIVNEAAASGQLQRLDLATLGLDRWPLANAPYLFGEEFLAWLEERFGDGIGARIARAHSEALSPYLDARTFRRVTGRGLSDLWKEFAEQRASRAPASGVAAGPVGDAVTPSERSVAAGPLTEIQTSPRVSPNGAWIAYTARTLDERGAIRVAPASLGAASRDPGRGRHVVHRLSGASLAWSADATSIIFDETDTHARFESRSDLYRVDLASGKRVRLTRGERASDADVRVAPSGSPDIVFVKRLADRSELAIGRLGANTIQAIRRLTHSEAGVEWSRPRFSPRGDAIAASRTAAGASNVVIVDPETGEVSPLLDDGALDADPAWLDNDRLLFRSDREGSFFLYLAWRDGSGLARLQGTKHAFTPDVLVGGREIVFARYTARGYRLSSAPVMTSDEAPLHNAAAPMARPEASPPAASDAPARPYSNRSRLLPTFWTPVVESRDGEWRVGAATFSFDPLRRGAWGVVAGASLRSEAPIGVAFAQWDSRLVTLSSLGRFESETDRDGIRLDTREARVQASVPFVRRTRERQDVTLVLRRETESLVDDVVSIGPRSFTNASAAIIWSFDSTLRFPMSISQQEGLKARLAVSSSVPALGAERDFRKAVAEAAAYPRFGPIVVASRGGFGVAFGADPPARSFTAGGFASPAILDPTLDEPALLRGYETPNLRDASRFGTRIAYGNLEARVPLFHPQRGIGALPFFLRHVHAAVFLDAVALARDDRRFSFAQTRVAAGGQVGVDLFLGHRIPLTVNAGIARGLTLDGLTRAYVRFGSSF